MNVDNLLTHFLNQLRYSFIYKRFTIFATATKCGVI